MQFSAFIEEEPPFSMKDTIPLCVAKAALTCEIKLK